LGHDGSPTFSVSGTAAEFSESGIATRDNMVRGGNENSMEGMVEIAGKDSGKDLLRCYGRRLFQRPLGFYGRHALYCSRRGSCIPFMCGVAKGSWWVA